MIIQCKSCSRKFVARDKDIPIKGRMVQCGYCSVTWHQMPSNLTVEKTKKKLVKPIETSNEGLSVESIVASDGKTYKFLGSQWAVLLPSGKTGLFAKKKIGKELDKITGRETKFVNQSEGKKIKKELNPSSEALLNEQKLPDIYKPRKGLGFFSYIFLLLICGFSFIGILKTFENDVINYFPEAEIVYELIYEQLEFFAESVKNILVLVQDLIYSY